MPEEDSGRMPRKERSEGRERMVTVTIMAPPSLVQAMREDAAKEHRSVGGTWRHAAILYIELRKAAP